MSLPAPRPLSVSKSSSPAAARAAAQDAQIAQLVEQNRALEESVSQLRDQLSAEEARGIDAVNQIRERWKVESKEWRDGCDSIQARHRLAHLQTRVALEHERGFRLEDREALIREKTATLLRDYKITLFQARETDLVDQVAVLEEETQLQREEMANMLTRHEAEIARMSVELTHAEARQQENVEQVGNVVGERKALKAELATFQASLSSSAKQIERLNLQIENLHTHNSSLSAHNGELQHQVDKWQSLEGKGEKEAESLRKRRIELEVRVKELEVNLKESRAMGKKVTKLEASLLETQERVEQGHQDIAEAQAEAARAEKHAAKLERQVEKLQAALDAEKLSTATKVTKVTKPTDKVRLRVPSVIEEVDELESSDGEIESLPSKPRSRSQRPESIRAGNTVGKGKEKETKSAIAGSENILERPKKRGESKRREQESKDANMRFEDGEVVEDEVQEVLPPTERHDRQQEQDSDIEEIPQPVKHKKPPSRTGKAKETDAEDEDKEERRKKRARSKPASTTSGKKQAEVDTEEDQPANKKKRKLNVSSSNIFSGPAGFTWNQDGEGNLGIPSVLSPVKEGEPVPARTTSSSILGAFKTLW